MVVKEAGNTPALKKDINFVTILRFLITGQKSYVTDDFNVAHQMLRDESFGKTPLEWDYLRYLLTAEEDINGEGSAFTHKYPDEYWESARKLSEAIIKRASESPSEKAANKTYLAQFAADFFETFLKNQTHAIIDANQLGQEFSSKYILSILFKDPDALGPELTERLGALFEKIAGNVFYLYMLDQKGGLRSKITKVLAHPLISKWKREIDECNKEMYKIVVETLKKQPGSYLKKALADYSKEELQGEPIPEHIQYGQSLTLILAGIETTASVIASGVRELGLNEGLAKAFFESGEDGISTSDFVTIILAMYPPADPFRESPQTETEVAGQTIPANAIVRVDAKALHKKYTKALEASGKKLKPMDLVTFGEGLRKCAGYSLAMTELITFFDEFKKHVASVRYAGEDKDKYAVKQGLSTKPKDGTVEVTAKTQ